MNPRTGTVGGVILTAVVWAVVWAIPGGAIEAVDNIAPAARSFTRLIDMWPQTLALPGLVGGVLFSLLLLAAEGRRRVAELPISRTAGWGAVSGLLVAGFVVWVVAPGLSDPWQLAAALLGVGTLLGAVSGGGSPLLFRYIAERRASAAS